ncbi:MAG: ABC transporter substrate-binding protein [Bacteroidales bacterium]|nr:ABC transporter substrate-binding protein [Bacteroidales bacterium]
MEHIRQKIDGRGRLLRLALCVGAIFVFPPSIFNTAYGQAPGTVPVKVSMETQVIHGRKYYVHIVEKGQTVYSISRAYKVESFDAVTHVDIHFLHPGDTVWLPARGQFATEVDEMEAQKQEALRKQAEQKRRQTEASAEDGKESRRPLPSQQGSVVSPYEGRHREETPSTVETERTGSKPVETVERKVGKVIRMAVMMPLHLDQIDEISTSKFDVEQRGKKSYRQFEFIEFYEGVRMAVDELSRQGVSVELNVVDVSRQTADAVEQAFASHHVGQSDVVVALLFRDAFDKAAQLAREAGVYIVNPMSTRSEICAENPYIVKVQPSIEGQVAAMLANMKAERPNGHLYVVYGGANSEKPLLDEVKRQLAERGDIRYTLFNWSQSAKLASTLKATPGCNVLSVYDQKADQMRLYVSNLLNRLAAFKNDSPTLYTFADWTRDISDIDFSQLQLLNYHTFYQAWDMTNNVHVEFLKAFRDAYGAEPTSPLAAVGYDLSYYIVDGLRRRNGHFWNQPTASPASLLHPLQLVRRQAGLENETAQLFRLQGLRFVPAMLK